ncbi:cell division protein ZipA [Vibrio astriarenae]
MQELRFVLIIVGALAIAALLVHGLWTSKKEGKAKFGDKPMGKIDVESPQVSRETHHADDDDYEVVRKDSRSNDFVSDIETSDIDPLIDSVSEADDTPFDRPTKEEDLEVPSFSPVDEDEREPSFGAIDDIDIEEPVTPTANQVLTPQPDVTPVAPAEEPAEPELEVIVLNVHTSNSNQPFIGTKLFDSMQQNGLLYGEMDIFHRHADLSGTGKVLFSVANMMQPGTLQHNDPADFSTMGISFFMTLPCFGDAEQNFKLMLKTAQQIADDLGGEVQDDARKMMTPTRLDLYRKQIQEFKARKTA